MAVKSLNVISWISSTEVFIESQNASDLIVDGIVAAADALYLATHSCGVYTSQSSQRSVAARSLRASHSHSSLYWTVLLDEFNTRI